MLEQSLLKEIIIHVGKAGLPCKSMLLTKVGSRLGRRYTRWKEIRNHICRQCIPEHVPNSEQCCTRKHCQE